PWRRWALIFAFGLRSIHWSPFPAVKKGYTLINDIPKEPSVERKTMSLLSPSVVPPMAFRRQFYLVPFFPEVVSGCHQYDVIRGLHLSTHPDLPYTRVDRGEHSLVLLGFALDPRHPEWGESQILEHVLDQSGPTFASVCRAFDSIGGRWAA